VHFSKTVLINPELADARNNLGKVFLKEEKPTEAIECFNELIRRKEGSSEVYYNLAATMSKQGKYDEAIKCFNKALELDSEYPNVRSEMGTELLMAGRTNDAITCFNKSLETSTDTMEAYVNLAIAYSRLGNYEMSKQNRRKAAELKSDNPKVLNNLAWLLATGGDITGEDANRAIGFAERACELTSYNDAVYLDTLGVAYAAAGKFEEAKAMAGKALSIATSSGQEKVAREVVKRINLYEAEQPYRQR
jgi:tetratricopeptide (TPR) repeat protein